MSESEIHRQEPGQIRLFFTVQKAQADSVYQATETVFEEEGFPLAVCDDEAAGSAEVSLYVPDILAETAKKRLAAALNMRESAFEQEVLPQIDWVKHSLAALKPVRAGHFFVHGAHDRDKIQAGDISIEIEANRAFGTGHHGTTAGCLEMLEQIIRQENPRAILDIGTGSGILAIAAAKLGKTGILATDNDAVAIEIADENIVINHAAKAIATVCAEGFDNPMIMQAAPFDLIIANILAAPLIAMAADMAKFVTAGGSLLLSGILVRQEQAVLTAYRAQGLQPVTTLEREGWVALHLRKPH